MNCDVIKFDANNLKQLQILQINTNVSFNIFKIIIFLKGRPVEFYWSYLSILLI